MIGSSSIVRRLSAWALVRSLVSEPNKAMFVDWSPYIDHRWDVAADTAVPLGTLKILSEQVNAVPEGVAAHRVVKKLMSDRLKWAPAHWE